MTFEKTLTGRPNTVKTQLCLYNKWVKPLISGDGDIMYDMEHCVKCWGSQGLSKNTTKSLISLTARYIEWKTGKRPDVKRITQLNNRSSQKEKVKALTRDQARTLLKNMNKDKNLYTACLIAYHTGMRKGEVFGLQWEDIDFVKGMVYICRSYDGPTKNGQSRYVPLSDELEAYLLKVMPPVGTPETARVVPQIFEPGPRMKAWCRTAKVPEITFHGLRHTFATLALEAGRSPKQVQEVLGHSNLSTTLDIYWSSIKGDLELGFC